MYNTTSTITNSSSSPTHVLVEAENLVFLNHELQTNEHDLINKVDLCYIDPPYNTGNTEKTGFSYNDAQKTQEWVLFMRNRLQPAKRLLKKEGIIVVSIDDREVHTLRVLMDELFGKKNFIAQLVIDGGNPKNNAKFFSISHEYMIVYANDLNALHKSKIKWRKRREGIDLLLKKFGELKKVYQEDYSQITQNLKQWVKTSSLSPRLKVFYNADKKGLYTYADLSTPGNGLRYEVLHPVTKKPCQIPSRGWGVKESKMNELLKSELILFGKDETSQPMKKLYLKDGKDQVQKGILSYPSRTSTHMLEKILSKRHSFNNPKNLNLMIDLIELTTPENGVILDYFAGSGTTGHAVLELNRVNEKSSRKFVMVTNNDNNIFNEVMKPRLMHVFEKWKAKAGNKLIDNLVIKRFIEK